MEQLMEQRTLVVDADGYVWWYDEETDAFSMVRTNPDNSPIPFPLTVHLACEVWE